jgi:hypothetical protein
MEFEVNEVIKALGERIAELSKENAILQAMIVKITEPKKVTTLTTDAPKVQGTQGLK